MVLAALFTMSSIPKPLGVHARHFKSYTIEFENKYLEDFSCNTLNDKIVYYKNQGYGVRLNNNHSFVKAVKKNQKQINALWQIKDSKPASKAYFDHLKTLLSDKGERKFLKGFLNSNAQKSKFQRIEITKELEKQGVVSALNAWSEEIRRKSIVSITPKNVPKYNFNTETFTFNVGSVNGKNCRYTANVPTEKAAELGSSKTIYWEAVYYIGDENNASNVEIYFGSYPPSDPIASFSTASCN